MLPAFLETVLMSLLYGGVALVAYVANGSTFLQPLSEEEEESVLNSMRNGDEGARNILVERNLRLVAHIVKKFDNTQEDTDDLISIGTIGLIKAIQTFNRDRKTRLATYAARCIENEILMYLRSTKRIRAEVSLYDPIGVDKEGNEITLIDVLGTEGDEVSERVENQFEQNKILMRVRHLSGRERQVLEMRYGLTGDGVRRTQRDIAKMLGISRSYVSRIEKRAVIKLFNEMSAEMCRSL